MKLIRQVIKNFKNWDSLAAAAAAAVIAILQVHSLLIRMLIAGLDQQFISSVVSLSCSVVPHTLLLSDLITEALSNSLTQLKYVACLVPAQIIVCVYVSSSEDSDRRDNLSAIGNILRSCQKK